MGINLLNALFNWCIKCIYNMKLKKISGLISCLWSFSKQESNNFITAIWIQIDGLVQDRRNSIANALVLCLSCTS